jgi:hypothetical protein
MGLFFNSSRSAALVKIIPLSPRVLNTSSSYGMIAHRSVNVSSLVGTDRSSCCKKVEIGLHITSTSLMLYFTSFLLLTRSLPFGLKSRSAKIRHHHLDYYIITSVDHTVFEFGSFDPSCICSNLSEFKARIFRLQAEDLTNSAPIDLPTKGTSQPAQKVHPVKL